MLSCNLEVWDEITPSPTKLVMVFITATEFKLKWYSESTWLNLEPPRKQISKHSYKGLSREIYLRRDDPPLIREALAHRLESLTEWKENWGTAFTSFWLPDCGTGGQLFTSAMLSSSWQLYSEATTLNKPFLPWIPSCQISDTTVRQASNSRRFPHSSADQELQLSHFPFATPSVCRIFLLKVFLRSVVIFYSYFVIASYFWMPHVYAHSRRTQLLKAVSLLKIGLQMQRFLIQILIRILWILTNWF